ncbi:D-alanyl-D-alanine carboxypeptidase [Domibacillus indicus]|uniref:D-alanyl-D-alanine carboxypeptidase family protein n=1 Tax=Domibacillus indicus TaxID=1437523 RepID=UPI0020408F26|nr:D-alanyl-D-alanine carboxypeptidase family protein [Domibacillus indicus]MCM3791596.1 D-alanyl-D-alanine carboxypeptidase [Domibacillus indicus]
MRKRNGYRISAVVLSILLFFGLFSPGALKADAAFDVNAGAAILVDGETGQILFEKNSNQQLGVASMSKMMTEYLLLEAVKKGKVSLDDTYQVSEYVYQVSQDRSLSNVPLRADETYQIRELYEAMTIYSANAATIAIAEKIAGSEAEFVKLMNKKAKELGMEKAKFVNATGLNNKDLKGHHTTGGPTEENTMTARDVATLAYRLVNDYPEVLETAGIPKKKFREGTDDEIAMENWNWMLPSLVFEYEGMTGLKTGTTDFAGYCFTGTAERDGQKLIGIVMDATDDKGEGTYNARFTEMKKLMDYGFTQFERKEIAAAGSTVKGAETVPVQKGKEKEVKLETASDLSVLVPKASNTKYKTDITLNSSDLDKNNELVAPVKKGKVVGFVEVQDEKGEAVPFLKAGGQTKVQTAENVEKANWFVLSMRAVGGGIANGWHWLIDTITGWF